MESIPDPVKRKTCPTVEIDRLPFPPFHAIVRSCLKGNFLSMDATHDRQNRQPPFSSICIFAGSSWGRRPVYTQAARQLGRLLAERKIRLITGGGCVGLMNEAAESVLAAGGEVWGVIPQSLRGKNVEHPRLSRMIVAPSMHARKKTMFDLADAFIALPGGLGTLDELFEILTWSQLNLHAKPCGLLNVAGYFDPLLAFLDHAAAERFLAPDHRRMIVVESDPIRLLHAFATFHPPDLNTWISSLTPPPSETTQ